jgi:Lar family restriction alleviation protein
MNITTDARPARFTDHCHGQPIPGTPPPLPCPFCGRADMMGVKELELQNDANVYLVECEECGTEGPSRETQLAAALAWNSRPGSTGSSSDDTRVPGISNPVDGYAFLPDVDQIAGVVKLAEDAVFREAGRNEDLEAAWNALKIARKALASLRNDLEGVSQTVRAPS